MEQIKTIIKADATEFDDLVNTALKLGWQLVNRQVLPGSEGVLFYAELNMYSEPEELTEPEEVIEEFTAEWEVSRDPAHPLRCSKCRRPEVFPVKICPDCGRLMRNAE